MKGIVEIPPVTLRNCLGLGENPLSAVLCEWFFHLHLRHRRCRTALQLTMKVSFLLVLLIF